MPIHDQGYRRIEGERILHGRGWWIVARAAVRERVHDRWFLGLLLLACAPFVMRAVQIYIGTTVVRASFLAPSEETFRGFLDVERLFVFFVTVYAGSGLIANDRRANALQLYLSKPLTRLEYVAGKCVALAVFLFALTWGLAMVLLILLVMFTGSLDFIAAHPGLIPAISLASLLQVAVSVMTMVALSSLSKSSRFVAIVYAGVVLFSALIARLLRFTTGDERWILLSPDSTLGLLIDAFFDGASSAPVPVPMALLALGAVLAASAVILVRRVRAVEAVG